MIEAAYAQHLAATVDGLTYDEVTATGNLFLQYMPSEPDVAVMLIIPSALPQATNLPTSKPQLQAIVRADRFDVRGGDALAAAIWSELACLDRITLAEGTPDEVFVIGTTPSQSAPIALGVDDNQRPEWSLNFDLYISQPTTHRQPAGA